MINYNEPLITCTMTTLGNIEYLKNSADDIFKKMGNITKVNEMIPENQLRGYCIIDCEKGKVRLAFTLTPENPTLIQEYHLTIENN